MELNVEAVDRSVFGVQLCVERGTDGGDSGEYEVGSSGLPSYFKWGFMICYHYYN